MVQPQQNQPFGAKQQRQRNCGLNVQIAPESAEPWPLETSHRPAEVFGEGNYTDKDDMHEMNCTNLMEGETGVGGCVN